MCISKKTKKSAPAGGLLFVTLLATAEGIKVFIDIEHNTRITASNSKK